MEHRRSHQVFGVAVCLLLLISEISSLPFYTPDDYNEQAVGIREVLQEIDRQGGLTSAIVPRAYHSPNHRMMRKSQRSNSLRLRFGKRSVDYPRNSSSDDIDWPDNSEFNQLSFQGQQRKR